MIFSEKNKTKQNKAKQKDPNTTKQQQQKPTKKLWSELKSNFFFLSFSFIDEEKFIPGLCILTETFF